MIAITDKKTMEPGIYSISNDEYQQGSGISWNAAKLLARSGLHYWNEYLDPNYVSELEKEHSALGNAFHTLALEPHLFEKKFFIMPKFSQKKDDKEKKKAILEELARNRKIAIFQKAADTAYEMAESLRKVIDLSGLQSDEVEQSLFWKNAETGVLCKSRPDILRIDKSIIADIKTTNDASWRKFTYASKNYDYPLQAAMFLDGLAVLKEITIKEVYVLAIESKKPYACVPYIFSKKTLEEGHDKFLQALGTYKSCLKTNKWPSYPPMRFI